MEKLKNLWRVDMANTLYKYEDEINDILFVLLDRKGFDNWWENMEEEYQNEIKDELDQVLQAFRENLG